MLPRIANATLRHLLPVAKREARNLQNFFPLAHLLEEVEALDTEVHFMDDTLEEADGSDSLEDGLGLEDNWTNLIFLTRD